MKLCDDRLAADAERGILNQVVTGDESWIYKYDPCNERLLQTKRAKPILWRNKACKNCQKWQYVGLYNKII